MKVKVVPKKPIPGILPKNKWIDSEMELDLNKNEILRCINFGVVYDEDNNVIDNSYLSNYDKNTCKKVFTDFINNNTKEPVLTDKPVDIKTVETVNVKAEEKEEKIKEEISIDLKLVSARKEEEYIIIETELVTNTKLEKDMYGLFTILSGSRPMMEYKNNDEWIKFSNKFNNFSELENGDKFVFRFIPKNNSNIKYRISIKEANEVLVKFEDQINIEEI